ncbi:methyltransferase domain-containing protein [Cyanobium sp. HWJ4-Hawea]|uniref:methyltransferase domain-containing protein n=1 Tax=Cyanobium sp. HWJ4-Hawea TaxID=2823713 RepID=UPI0020CFE37A|nr:methyltransferase domain-containing protein [Cyanobium sp. HWJ4-Hawea]MCP9808046.1 methyltransferase domain-containing protein [Cyanobium sp. HWJ4-Hawea]
MSSAAYVLGCDAEEQGRLARQHATWSAEMQAGWQRAGFSAGQRLLDLGCGPGHASLKLAELVGPTGSVLAIDSSAVFLAQLEHQCLQRQLPQLQTLEHNLSNALLKELGSGGWDGAWCRWLAMFLPQLEPLLDLLLEALRPGGRLVMHEYLRWDTFSLHPRGSNLELFVGRCIGHWRSHGGDPDVAQRLPALLEERGFRLLHSQSLMACAPSDNPKALWLQDFLGSYPAQLMAAGCWSADEQQALEAELHWARQHASLWVTPALVEMVWERP